MKKPTLALKKKKINWFLNSKKKKKLVKKKKIGDECGSWEKHNKNSCHPFTTITILSLHMVVALQR